MCKGKLQLIYVTIIISFGIIFLSGCTSNQSLDKYNSVAKEFNKIYFETVQSSDSSDPDVFIKDMQSEINKKNIEKLKLLLIDIEKYIPKDRTPLYKNFKKRYDDLFFLEKCYEHYDNLSDDEKGRIDNSLISIGVNIRIWNNKKSTILWQ